MPFEDPECPALMTDDPPDDGVVAFLEAVVIELVLHVVVDESGRCDDNPTRHEAPVENRAPRLIGFEIVSGDVGCRVPEQLGEAHSDVRPLSARMALWKVLAWYVHEPLCFFGVGELDDAT